VKRFFVEKSLGGGVELVGSEHHHLCNVLRMRTGDEVILVCGDEFDYKYLITSITKTNAQLRFVKKETNKHNPTSLFSIYLGAIKPDSLHVAVTGLNEVGVSDLYIFKSKHSNANVNIEKLNSIAKQSCKQCGRSIPLKVHEIEMKDIPKNSIVIGPEGGFTDDELELIGKQPYLGARTLRAETAVVIAAALQMKELEKW